MYMYIYKYIQTYIHTYTHTYIHVGNRDKQVRHVTHECVMSHMNVSCTCRLECEVLAYITNEYVISPTNTSCHVTYECVMSHICTYI